MTIRPMRVDEVAVGRHAFVRAPTGGTSPKWATQVIAGVHWIPVVLVKFGRQAFADEDGGDTWLDLEVEVRATELGGNAISTFSQFRSLFVIEPC